MTEFLETLPSAHDHRVLMHAAHPDWTVTHRRRVRSAFRHSDWVASAYVDGLLAGTIRIVTDHVSFGLIADLLVHPDHRHQGIGSTLVKMAVVAHPDYYLYADPQTPELAPFYTKAGFTDHTVWRHH
jgi:GNAT superfamily N-acetyltransferase